MNTIYHDIVSQIQDTGNYRRLFLPRQGSLDFSSNDYLNLSRHPLVIAAACQAALDYGTGATGSRLLSGNYALIEQLEQQIAQDKKSESSLVFATGYQANMSVLSALLIDKPIVFFDKLNHASLYQAVQDTPCQLVRYRSGDIDHLSDLLGEYAASSVPKWIITETVFGMDGTIIPLQDIVNLSDQYGAWLYLDEAHATGLYGPQGYGLSTTVDLSDQTIVMGTFSKALGASGAYVACPKIIKSYLVNRAKGFLYSTAPSPMLTGAVLKAWEIISTLDQERHDLMSVSNYARDKLVGFNILGQGTNIIPVIIGEPNNTLEYKRQLDQSGITVSAIRSPTVPPKTDRLRIALRCQHTFSDIDHLIEALGQ